MRILYGVVGEGMGHAIRSRVVLDELVKRHEVQVVVSGRAHDYLAQRAGEHLQVRKIWGFTMVTEDNEVRNFRTLLSNVRGAIGGSELRGLPDEANPDALDQLHETVERKIHPETGDALQLVERAAGVAETAPAHHRDANPAHRGEGGERQ